MTIEAPTDVAAPPAPAILLQMMTGYWASQAIYVAAKLGIADHLAEGLVDVRELARATATDAGSLYRLLRTLASTGIFSEVEPGQFGLTPLAALLRTGTPDSMRALAITYNEEQYRAWGDLLYSVQTGGVAFEHHYGMMPFDYFETHPETDRVFNEAMISWSNQVAGAVASTFDFSPFSTIADIGGGHGAMLTAILQHNPAAQGILFDMPRVVAGAETYLQEAGVADRCERIGGDFFTSVPAGADAYILSQILHDWDVERCGTILRTCRRAIPDHGKLLVVELVLPAGETPAFGKWLDLHMMVVTGGRERTAAQYGELLRMADFALVDVVPTAPGPGIVVAEPV